MTANQKLLTPAQLRLERDHLDADGKRLVLTNGCFDILHAGHIRYLEQARALGDALAIVLNGDRAVRELKGEGRPINNQDDRAEVLAALACVDYVTHCDSMRVTPVIEAVAPHLYAKGGDYTEDSLDRGEYNALKAAGSEIRILPLVPGKSTTAVIKKMRAP